MFCVGRAEMKNLSNSLAVRNLYFIFTKKKKIGPTYSFNNLYNFFVDRLIISSFTFQKNNFSSKIKRFTLKKNCS